MENERKNHELEEVVRVCRRAGTLLSESLWEYWPAVGKLELAERNLSLHFGVALWERGFRLYAEAHPDEHPDRHLDLFAYNPITGTQVFCEFKRARDSKAFPEMEADLERILEFRPRSSLPGARFGVIGCLSWQPELADWWVKEEGVPNANESLQAFYDRIRPLSPSWGRIQLQQYYNSRESFSNQNPHHYLYAAFALD